MNFKLFKKAVSTLNWKLDYFDFCEQIMCKHEKLSREVLANDKYCLKKWQEFQQLNNVLNGFNENTLSRIISVYESTTNDKVRNLDLPGGLADYNEIAVPVIELFESMYMVERDRQKGCRDIACWKITEPTENQSAYLFLSSGFEWNIGGKTANEQVPDCFLFDVYDFCDANGVHLEELFDSLTQP